jgi:homoserine O-succinyltransferase/O-acetyltransferase
MPVYLDGNSSSHERLAHTMRLCGKSPAEFPGCAGRSIHIGLINNMPDAAMEATERQFLTLLDAASEGVLVRLTLYALPDVPRNDAGRRHISRFYSGIESLWNGQHDGLIVTGRAPRTPNLMDEPYWGSMTRVLEWANDNTHSTIWSCLAAHAALLHMDGIARHTGDEKRCGILECAQFSDHQLMAGIPPSFKMPHSRWNDIPENELTACGYHVLTRARDAGVDTFVKRRNSLFVFFQGHPEYEPGTLLLEYRRDVGRYLRGETDNYPSMPRSYFDEATADALTALQERAMYSRREELLANVVAAATESHIPNTWHSAARRIYGNWLRYIGRQKEQRLRSKVATSIFGDSRVQNSIHS